MGLELKMIIEIPCQMNFSRSLGNAVAHGGNWWTKLLKILETRNSMLETVNKKNRVSIF